MTTIERRFIVFMVNDAQMLPNAAAKGRAGVDAQPGNWMLSARSLE